MSIGFWQIVVIAFIVVGLFNAGRINRFLKELGKGVKSFKDEIEDPKASSHKKTSTSDKVVSLEAIRSAAPSEVKAKPLTKKSAALMKKAVKKVASKKSAAKAAVAKVAAKKATVKKTAAKKAVGAKAKTAPKKVAKASPKKSASVKKAPTKKAAAKSKKK